MLGVSSTTLAPPPGSKEISMSIVVLQALLAAYAVITFGVALRMRSRARTVTLVFPSEITETGRHAARRPVLV
jgi:hypothetical protein